MPLRTAISLLTLEGIITPARYLVKEDLDAFSRIDSQVLETNEPIRSLVRFSAALEHVGFHQIL